MSSSTTINRHHLYRLTAKILNTHSLHFIPISLLFLPFSFSASAALQFYFSSSSSTTEVVEFDPFNLLLIKTIITSSQNLLLTLKTLTTVLAFFFLVILPTVTGVALIINSTNQIIHHKQVTFSSTVKSLKHSFLPLLHTVTSGSIKLILIFFAFTLFPIILTEAIKALGFHSSLFVFSIFINSIVSYALATTILFFIAIWGSAPAITVLESRSGFEALRQSANQPAEFRRNSFSIVFVTGFALYTSTSQKLLGWTGNWILFLQIGAMGLQSSLMILMYVVANTVLYVQCKVESTGEGVAVATVEGEVSGEYVRVGANDKAGEVVADAVDEEAANGGFNYMLYMLTVVWAFILSVQFYHLFMLFSNV